MNGTEDIPIGLIMHRDLFNGLKALTMAHCAGNGRNKFSAGYLTGLLTVAALAGIEEQFKNEVIKILHSSTKAIEIE